tara:strand:- start:1793 stop:3607 length:1815 start_codon:yes stop_codon:yes gene_type:complete
MKIITLDFETYYSKECGFSKLTTEEYVRDKQFEIIGVSIKIDQGETVWFSGTKKDTQRFLNGFDWDNAVAIAHNAMFDMAILNWHFDIRPSKIADTLSMAKAIHGTEVSGSLAALAQHYGLGEKGTEVMDAIGKRRLDFTKTELQSYAQYCINDTELTYKLFVELIQEFPISELDLIDLTIRMFTEPAIELDAAILTTHLTLVRSTKDKLMESITEDRKQLMSNDKLALILGHHNVVAPTKISPTTGKETYAFAKTDEEFKALLSHADPYIQALVAARLGVKSTIEETRTERFLDVARRGLLPIPLRYYAAHTGRWGGADKINMQNLPRGSQLKKAMCAPKGYKFIDCDLSQIEARTLAWLAQQNDLVTAFERGDDVYTIMAATIYGIPENEITKEQRFIGKQTTLGCGYGMGFLKFKNQLKTFGVELPTEECKRIIEIYRETYSRIPHLWRSATQALQAIIEDKTAPLGKPGVLNVQGKRGIQLPNTLYLKYPNLRVSTDQEMVYDSKRGRTVIEKRIYGGKVIENVCQALARIVIGEHLLKISKQYKVVMTVHDAIGCIVPSNQEEQALLYIERVMKTRPAWAMDLPLDCESGSGASYGECA